ncbi:MAG TPA: methyltransferase domain-containing protein [Thermodesulfobacteriota bacterium]|nr:methyltransferase domain-containing protein [Thermodesulfobacteriota bacterium]
MKTPFDKKSTVAEIRERFDADVERFSNIGTGQQAVIDAPLVLDLISGLAVSISPDAENLLDIGSGAGNNTIAILRRKPGMNCDLVDLSLPMLERAKERLREENADNVRIFQGDFRDIDLPLSRYDIIVAAAVLHHLRDDLDWESCFGRIYGLLRPGGAFFVSDLVIHENESVHNEMWKRYGDYLEQIGGPGYSAKVFDYIDKEDTPRSLTYQLEMLKKSGFRTADVLHKNSCFAAYVGIK